MAAIENIIVAAHLVVALVLVLVALRSWRHAGGSKLLLLALGFGLFLVKSLLVAYGLFNWPDLEARLFLPLLVLDLAVLAVFYLAVYQRSAG